MSVLACLGLLVLLGTACVLMILAKVAIMGIIDDARKERL